MVASYRRVPFRRANSVIMPSISTTSFCSYAELQESLQSLHTSEAMLSCAEDKSPKPYERYKYSGVELEYPKYITSKSTCRKKKTMRGGSVQLNL